MSFVSKIAMDRELAAACVSEVEMADTEQVRTTLSTLLNVEFPPDFATLFYGVRPCHLRPKSWHPVPFDWDALNVALRNGRFLPPRLRLSHSRPETLADLNIHAWLGTRSQVASPSLRRKALHEGLARGATLILDSADEVSEGLRDLALGMSSALRKSIGMNCYASVRADENFGAHWDEHDVFAYQMCGRKRWLLFSIADQDETGDFRTIEDKCPAQVSAEIILDRGDVLYIPRGCWHQVIGIGEPWLHVSIGVVRRRAIDLLKSLIGQLDEDPLWGATIPRFGRPERP